MTSIYLLGWNLQQILLGVDAGGVEGEGFDFAFCALGGDFLIVEEEGDAGGVADFDDDLLGRTNAGVGGRDESFLGARLAVSGDGDPGGFCGADCEAHRRSRGGGGSLRGCGRWGLRLCRNGVRRNAGLESSNGHVAAVVSGADLLAVVFVAVVVGGGGFCGRGIRGCGRRDASGGRGFWRDRRRVGLSIESEVVGGPLCGFGADLGLG